MSSVWDRIQEAASEKGLSGDSAIAKVVDVSHQAIRGWREKPNTDLRASNLISLADYLQVEPAWIATGRLPKRREGFSKIVLVKPHEGEDGFPLPLFLFTDARLDHRSCYMLRARNNSMAPSIKLDDAVMFDTTDVAPVVSGKMYVIDWGSETGIVKRLFVEPDGSMVAHSDNPSAEYAERRVSPPHAGVRVHGRVRWIGRWED